VADRRSHLARRESNLPGALAPPSGQARAVEFNVGGARRLSARYRSLYPGLRTTRRLSWRLEAASSLDTRAPISQRLFARIRPGAQAPTPLWFWESDEDAFAAQAPAILRHFIHPLLAEPSPFCLGFPFAPGLLEPRALQIAERAQLDLEDIGALLLAACRRSTACLSPAGAGERAAPAPTMAPAPRHVPAAGDGFDADQRAAVVHRGGAARVLAPAGSGKTKTLVGRVAELVRRGVRPSQILLLAFNTKAAGQLEERLAQHGIATTRRIDLDSPEEAAHCATFNAFAARYQREVMASRITIDDGGSRTRAAVRASLVACGLTTSDERANDDLIGAVLSALPRVRAALQPPESISIPLPPTDQRPEGGSLPFTGLHTAYARLQGARGFQSFNDQIYFAVADLLASPERRRRLQARYAHILVDEFQDLNGAQLALVDILSRPHRNVYVVGDDDQLIYGWRFADPTGILEFHERMPPGSLTTTYRLSTNYRCSRAVVGAAARLIANNQRREGKLVQPASRAPEGALHFVAAPEWQSRAASMCAFLQAEHGRLNCPWSELAVLSRYRSQQLAVALALDAEGIPRAAEPTAQLLASPTAQLVRAVLELARDARAVRPGDLTRVVHACRRSSTAGRRAAATPCSWAEVKLAAAAEPSGDPRGRPLSALVTLVSALIAQYGVALTTAPPCFHADHPCKVRPAPPAEQPPRSAAAAGAAGEQHDTSAQTGTAAHLLAAIVRGLALDAREPFSGSQAAHGEHDQPVESLMALAQAFPHPAEFVAAWDRLAADGPKNRDGADDDVVVIGTIHAAKGREYRSVVIPDYDCDVTHWSAAEIEEERRVVYVGVTRAAESLLFTIDSTRPYVHPFLRELVPPPAPGERTRLLTELNCLEDAGDNDVGPAKERLVARLCKIEALFPETLLESEAPARAPGGDEPTS